MILGWIRTMLTSYWLQACGFPPVDGVCITVCPVIVRESVERQLGSMQVPLAPVSINPRILTDGGTG